MRQPKLNVCICSNRPHPPRFTLSLTYLMVTLARSSPFAEIGIQIKENVSVLSIGRQSSVKASIEHGFTHILFIDDDSVFPANAAHVFFAHQRRIVAANFVKKVPEWHPSSWDMDNKEMTSAGKTGLERASRIGFGFVLMDLDVFRTTMPPHFEVPWNPDLGTYTGEDIFFSRKMLEAGEDLWVDHDVSNVCGHIGDHVYRHPSR